MFLVLLLTQKYIIVGFGLFEMTISINPEPTIYRHLKGIGALFSQASFQLPWRIQPCSQFGTRNVSYKLMYLSYQGLIDTWLKWSTRGRSVLWKAKHRNSDVRNLRGKKYYTNLKNYLHQKWIEVYTVIENQWQKTTLNANLHSPRFRVILEFTNWSSYRGKTIKDWKFIYFSVSSYTRYVNYRCHHACKTLSIYTYNKRINLLLR